jgi:hypothetical protein
VHYEAEIIPDEIAVPVGAFADASIPGPTIFLFEQSKHPWMPIPQNVTVYSRGRHSPE